ncbi:hypothetical protein RHSIM_Rhsim01G0246100 [Rhododendron simsii]|uniref:Uncharacterized protein n=1 Tax=Rhododendron simsii TaxID=118357 RepID=A0A834HLT2_RHOSS|nr:hypothetical protein RHSIM_Rhsim01G0246100 [Rhododendron simsii]
MENPSDSSSAANITTTKRYAPPFQRKGSLGRRKSGGGSSSVIPPILFLDVDTSSCVVYGSMVKEWKYGTIMCNTGRAIFYGLNSEACPLHFPDRFERINNSLNDGEKNQVATSKHVPLTDHGDVAVVNENLHPRLISLHGCCKSDAFQLLNERWAATINAFNDPTTDFADRPVMYTGSGGSAWGQFRLPHQFNSPRVPTGSSSGSQMDFLSELRRAKHHDANASSAT